MADSLKFTIGGQLGPSYRGALAQAEAEALRANNALNAKIHAQQARIAALDKAYAKAAPGSAEASAIAMQQYGKRMAMEKELQLMQLKHNLTASVAARKMEADKVAAAAAANAEKIAANRASLDTIIAQEREAAIAEAAIQDAAVAAKAKATAERIALSKKAADAQILSERLAEAEIVATGRRIAAAKAAEDLAVLTNVARGYGASASGGGAHGKAGLTGIIRESLVIAREIAMGRGGARVAGSVTLLAQYMGLLGKVVKSTAAEQVMASAAASKLSQSMSAEAMAAKGTADFARLSAAALKQETIAAEAATEAEVALQTAKVSLNPLGWVLVSGAVIAGVLMGIALHMQHVAQAAKNLSDMLNPLKKKFTEQADALRENAKEHQEYLDWLKKVGAETETLPERIDRVIRKMREQAQAEMELARLKGRSRVELERMEEAELKAELMVVTRGKLQANREAEEAKTAAEQAEQALQNFDPSNLKGAERVAKNAGEILDAVQDRMEKAFVAWQQGDDPHAPIARKATEKDVLPGVKVDGKQLPPMSVEQAKAAYDKATKESERLSQIQKELHDTLANDKTTVEQKTKAVQELTAEQQKILDELGIKQTTGREIAKYSGNRGRISDGEMERAGLFQSAALIRTHDTLLESLKVQRHIEQNTRRTGGTHPGRGGVNFG